MDTIRLKKGDIFKISVKSNEFHIFMNDILPKARKYVFQKLEYRETDNSLGYFRCVVITGRHLWFGTV